MTKTIEFKKLSIDLNNDWKQIIGKWNWVNFNLLKIYTEKDNIYGLFEIEIYLLGLGIRFYWFWDKKRMDKKFKQYKKIISKGNFKRLDRNK